MEYIVKILKVNPWSGLTKWNNCFDYVGSYFTRSGSVYTGLTAEEATRLEKELGYQEGHLAPHSPFWETFAVRLGKNDTRINTDRPEGELKYLFLKNHKHVAVGMKEVNPTKDYVLIDVNSEAEQINRANQVKYEAIAYYMKMSMEEKRKALRLFGHKADTMSNELVESTLSTEIENNPKSFMNRWIDNPVRDMQFMIEEAIAKNILRRNHTNYYFGTDLIGHGLEDAIAYLSDKKNQDVKMAIKNELESK